MPLSVQGRLHCDCRLIRCSGFLVTLALFAEQGGLQGIESAYESQRECSVENYFHFQN